MKTFEYDFENKEFVVRDGKLVPTDDIRIWIEKALRSEKFKSEIYDGEDYGATLEDLVIGTNYPRRFIESEIDREVRECLLKNPEIAEIRRVTLTDENIIEVEVLLNDERTATAAVAL